MNRLFACFLAALLLQTLGPSLLLANYELNKAQITARFCGNKARPALHCNGKCYFAQQLKKQQQREEQAPGPLKERLEMLPVGEQSLVPSRPATYPAGAAGYGLLPAPAAPELGLRAVFHPPQRQA